MERVVTRTEAVTKTTRGGRRRKSVLTRELARGTESAIVESRASVTIRERAFAIGAIRLRLTLGRGA